MSNISTLFLLGHAKKIIEGYTGENPLHFFLQQYFRQHKNLGSKDRKRLRQLVYNYFRLGKSFNELPMEEKIITAHFLLDTNPDYFLADKVRPEVQSVLTDKETGIEEKLQKLETIHADAGLHKVFPFASHLSGKINKKDFLLSLLKQPLVWIRIRKKYTERVAKELAEKQINIHVKESETCLGFESATELTNLETFKKGYFEIQDMSSQQTLNALSEQNKNEVWWDCCAGSGGKSLLLFDRVGEVELFMSDARSNILDNAIERLGKLKNKDISVFEFDILSEQHLPELFPETVDGIIADVPCSGSGTWSRTPELITFFKEAAIKEYAGKQKIILKRIAPKLKQGGILIYITCSVFKEENEVVTDYAIQQLGFEKITETYLTGYNNGADTLYTCILKMN